MGLFGRRPIEAKGANRFTVNLGDEERAVLRAVCEDVDDALGDDDAADANEQPLFRRLFPAAHADDPELDAQYRSLVHDDLLASHRAALSRVAATADDPELDRATLEQWLTGVNAVRLVLGTRLDVSEDPLLEIDPEDPELPARAVYEFLGGVLDAGVRALSRTL